MAKAALELPFSMPNCVPVDTSFASYLGATKTRVLPVSVGIMNSLDELLRFVEGYLAEGYLRIKLKIEPGSDYEPVKLIRETFGEDLSLQVDANTAYSREDFESASDASTISTFCLSSNPSTKKTSSVTRSCGLHSNTGLP
jgi:O-succinylbenzoate synthase